MLKDAVINAKDVNYDKIQSSEKKTIEELVEEQGEDFPEPVRILLHTRPLFTSPPHHLTTPPPHHPTTPPPHLTSTPPQHLMQQI